MEIVSIESIPLSHSLQPEHGFGGTRGIIDARTTTLLRAETSDGLVGWGEALAPPRTVASAIDEVIAPHVIGRSPYDVNNFVSDLYAGNYQFGRGPIIHSAMSAADIALWDIMGQAVGEPISRLLGSSDSELFVDGTDPAKMIPYASTMYITEWGEDPTEPIEAAAKEGFKAAKIKIGGGIEDDVNRVRIAREVLGDEAYLMVDYNGNYRPKQALKSIQALEPYDIHWAEEPIPPENYSGYRELSRMTSIPLAAGEAHFTRSEFSRLLKDRLIDIVQPNVTRCGGLSEARFIAKTATNENVTVRPHVWNGAVGVAASLHFAASIPAYPHAGVSPEPMLFEFDRSENPLRSDLLEEPLDPTNNEIEVPQSPGLGITINEDIVEQYRIDNP